MNSNQKDNAKKSGIKIIVPIIIVSIIIGIWFLKNSDKGSETTAKPTNESVSEEKLTTTSDNPDFELFVTEALDLEQLKSYGLPIVIDFGADSCIPCKEMAPVLEKLNKELQGKAIVRFVDVWKYPELVQNFPINVIPTQIFIDKDGNPYNPTDPQSSQMIMYSTQDSNEHVFTTHAGGMTEEMMLSILAEMGLEE